MKTVASCLWRPKGLVANTTCLLLVLSYALLPVTGAMGTPGPLFGDGHRQISWRYIEILNQLIVNTPSSPHTVQYT